MVLDDAPLEPASGGTIKQVLVNVSGEPYLDLEKESMAVMSGE